VSPVQFRKSNLLDVIMCALVDSGLLPDRLEIEITERVLLERESAHLSTLHQLKNLGVAITFDDFGTGYSAFSHLRTFPFDRVKIDGSITGSLPERTDSAAVICAIIALGRSLGYETVAEGIETQQQLQSLRAAGLTHAQGFLFARPVPAAELRFALGEDVAGDILAGGNG
jgi:EAL domain-containing protein (putative c-di-GMP-specific phosphodiesterase class I)